VTIHQIHRAARVVLGMLSALGHEQRRSPKRSSSGLTRWLEVDGKADEPARERLLTCTSNSCSYQEEPWK